MAHPFTCRVCGSLQLTPVAQVPYLRMAGLCRFLECRACGTVCDAGIFQDGYGAGSNAQYTWADIKFYIEYIGGPAAFADCILGLKQLADSRNLVRPCLLDVGTAFGFAVSVAQFIGWDAIGVEPSQFGEYGRTYLKAPILTTYLEDAPLDKASFDFILINDVIEHVADPVAFVAAIVPFLKPTGVLFITTPNSQVVSQQLEPDPVDVLSPGYHLNILSPASLSQVLRQNGFGDEVIQVEGGLSGRQRLVALAALQENVLPASIPHAATDVSQFLRTYLEKLAADLADEDDPHNPLYGGTLFHLLEMCMNVKDYAQAEIYEAKLFDLGKLGASEKKLTSLETTDFEQYVSQVPAYFGMFYFYRGMLNLHHRKAHAPAAHAFDIAHRLFLIEQRTQIYPHAGWPERALQNKTLAQQYLRSASLSQRLRAWLACR